MTLLSRLSRIPASSLANIIAVALLVIVAVGLLVPALVRGMETYRKSQCMDNLRVIALATHKYHKEHGCLPPGWLGPNPDGPFTERAPNVGALVNLLPYLDQSLAADPSKLTYYQGDLKARTDSPLNPDSGQAYTPPSDAAWWTLTNPATGVSNLSLAHKRFRVLVCPSATAGQDVDGVLGALHVYGTGVPDNFLYDMVLTESMFPGVAKLGRTNYLGSAGMAGTGGVAPLVGLGGRPAGTWGDYEGVFGNRSALTLDRIAAADGTSNTLMFGESLGGVGGVDLPGYPFSWFCGALPTYYGLPEAAQNSWRNFSSNHPDVVLFAFADASVRGIRRGTNYRNAMNQDDKQAVPQNSTTQPFSESWWVLQQLAGWRDGNRDLPPALKD